MILRTRFTWVTRVTLTYEIQSEIHVCVFNYEDKYYLRTYILYLYCLQYVRVVNDMIRYLRSYEGEIFISKRLRRSPRCPPAGNRPSPPGALYPCPSYKVWDESETVSNFNRWSFCERKAKKGFLATVWSWIFIDTSVKERGNFLIDGFPQVARPDIFWRVLIDGASVKDGLRKGT